MMAVHFSGMQDALRRFEQMGKIVENTSKEKALKKGAEYLQGKLEDNVYSHGLKKRTGNAEKSFIVSEVVNDIISIGVTNSGDGFYLYFHEFGFYNTWAKKKLPPKPFAQPTFENESNNVQEIMINSIKEDLSIS